MRVSRYDKKRSSTRISLHEWMDSLYNEFAVLWSHVILTARTKRYFAFLILVNAGYVLALFIVTTIERHLALISFNFWGIVAWGIHAWLTWKACPYSIYLCTSLQITLVSSPNSILVYRMRSVHWLRQYWWFARHAFHANDFIVIYSATPVLCWSLHWISIPLLLIENRHFDGIRGGRWNVVISNCIAVRDLLH